MKRKIALAILALTLIAAPAIACMGILVRTEVVAGGVICTYRMSDGSSARVAYPNTYACPYCLE